MLARCGSQSRRDWRSARAGTSCGPARLALLEKRPQAFLAFLGHALRGNRVGRDTDHVVRLRAGYFPDQRLRLGDSLRAGGHHFIDTTLDGRIQIGLWHDLVNEADLTR